MKFEPCNPPLVDPLFFDTLQKLLDGKLIQLDLPLTLPSSLPLKPVPIRPSSPPDSSGTTTLLTPPSNSPRALFAQANSSRSPFQPVATSQPYLTTSSDNLTASCDVVTPPHDFITPSHDVITPSRDVITPLTSRYDSSSSPTNTPDLPGKTSSRTTSPRSTPYTKQKKRIADRQAISERQSEILKDWFAKYTYLSAGKRPVVSRETGLPEKSVMYWFQNQRRRVKRSIAK